MKPAAALAALAVLAVAPAATAAPPQVSISASALVGPAPLRTTLTAAGDAAAYRWDLGDGTRVEGATVEHAFRPGRWTVNVTAVSATGEEARADGLVIVSRAVELAAPARAAFGAPVELGGRVVPAEPRLRVPIYRGRTYVTTAVTDARGAFRTKVRLTHPGPYHARYGAARSAERLAPVRPQIVASLPAATPLGTAPLLRARLLPARAGTLVASVFHGGKLVSQKTVAGALRLPVAKAGSLRVTLAVKPRAGFGAARATLRTSVVAGSLALGSNGPSVLALETRLAELRYALRGIDRTYGHDTFEAVLAFQKVHGLPRTGRVDELLWRRLAQATPAMPRHAGPAHVEVDKSRQVLFEVEGSQVTRIVHVSTGATGNTPLGSWRVYRKVPGWDWVLWYPLYFKGGFAIHGYPSVPAYPASHGCVRVPMWIAPSLYARYGHGATVTVYA